MNPAPRRLAASLFLTAATACLHAEAVKDREGAVRADKAARGADPRWNYNDLDAGFAEAARTGKPLLAVLRCVPCLSCMGIDGAVLEDAALAPLLDQFVCVRLINTNNLDLSLFQFDYDLSFSALVFRADRTLYARWGSWLHQREPGEKSLAGLQATLQRVLAAHKAWPAGKEGLAGKQAGLSKFRTPVDIPGLAGKYQRGLDWEGAVVKSCVHCHQIGDALRTWHREQRQPMPADLIWPMPPPDVAGFTLDHASAARISAVAAASAAAAAGIQPGDELTELGGQPVFSAADVSWVLHRTAAEATLPGAVQRGSKRIQVALHLPAGWREKSDIARRVGTWGMRAMAFGGLVLEDVPDDERTTRSLGTSGLALRVKHVGQYGNHAAAKRAGFQKDDVLTAFDGCTERLSEGALLGRILTARLPGAKVAASILRGAERITLEMPIQ